MQIFVVLRKISKEKNVMKQDIQRIMLAAAKPLFLIFILYILKIMEVGMDWDFSRLGVYPMEKRGLVGILTHPFTGKYNSFIFLVMVSFLLLPGDSR